MKTTLKLLSLILILFAVACSDSDDDNNIPCDSQSFNQEFQEELEAVSIAANNYGMNPTTENCEIFKAAYIDYIDALEGWEECATFHNQEVEWRQALDDARVAANDIMC